MNKKRKSVYSREIRKYAKAFIAFVLTFIIVSIVLSLTGCAPVRWFSTAYGNQVDYVDQKIDDATNYDTKKKVEDTCRSMIASYESDKMTYEQYKDSDNEEKQSWAEQAKMRANKTAATYNNYILENDFVWSGNVPGDIQKQLKYIE